MRYLAIFLMSVMIWACERSHVTDMQSQDKICTSDFEIWGMYSDVDSLWMFSVQSDLSDVYELYWMLNGEQIFAYEGPSIPTSDQKVLESSIQSRFIENTSVDRSTDVLRTGLADVAFRMSRDRSHEVCIIYFDNVGCHQSCVTILPEVLVVDTKWYLAFEDEKAFWIIQPCPSLPNAS